jgi:hypothetical protein
MTIELVREFSAGTGSVQRMGRVDDDHVGVLTQIGAYTWRLRIFDITTGTQTDETTWDGALGASWSDNTPSYRLVGSGDGMLLALTQDLTSASSPYTTRADLRRITVSTAGAITSVTATTLETADEPDLGGVYYDYPRWGLHEAAPGYAMLTRVETTASTGFGLIYTQTVELYHVNATSGLTVSAPITSWSLDGAGGFYPNTEIAWYPYAESEFGQFSGTLVRAAVGTDASLTYWEDVTLGGFGGSITLITGAGPATANGLIGHPDGNGGSIGQVYDGTGYGRLVPGTTVTTDTYPLDASFAVFDHVTVGPATIGPVLFRSTGASLWYVSIVGEAATIASGSAVSLYRGFAVTCGVYVVVLTSGGKVGVFGLGVVETTVEPALRLLQRGDSLGIEGSARLGGPTNVGNNPGTLQYNPAPRLTQGGNVFR